MDAKISCTVWSDPDLDNQPAEVLLTLHWMKTNPDRNDCGAYRFSASRFSFQTRLTADWHAKTVAALPHLFAQDGHNVLYVPFIRECLQLGETVGKNGGINLGAKALTKPFKALTKPLQDRLLSVYPELIVVWRPETLPEALGKPLVSPSVAATQGLQDASEQKSGGSPEGLGKGLPSPSTEKSSKEKRRTGECEGIGAEVPEERTVLEFARNWQDLSRGLSEIPEGYALEWLAFRCTPKAGPFPRDWKKDLVLRYVGAVVQGKTARGGKTPRSRRSDLEGQLKYAESAEERLAIRQQLVALEKTA